MSNFKLILVDKWNELDNENETSENSVYSKLLLDINAPCNFYVALDTVNNLRILIIETDPDILLPKYIYPDIIGLEIYPKLINGKTRIFIKVIDNKFNELFESLCTDLVSDACDTDSPNKCIDKFFYKLHIWKDFFKNISIKTLTKNSAQGLFGELYFINNLTKYDFDLTEVIKNWTGPSGEEYDFKMEKASVEIKTTKTRTSIVTISNLMQLDNAKCENLFLVRFGVELQTIKSSNSLSLPRIIDEIRQKTVDTLILRIFDQKLIALGYVDNSFDDLNFIIVEKNYYEINDNFPKLTMLNIPKGIKSAKYTLDLDFCNEFLINENAFLKKLKGE
ncbi:PD-(D/E)XK motif protein [Aliarcobacter butzleri]|uniref:PD-(D/E)XK motif protein n=1 Tax=Aliarcobacter butzleri TaxID=28197 RepID=UPI00191A30A3|nr:PD-(D/E)XK motif protein [Aliarcobacter butzleri]